MNTRLQQLLAEKPVLLADGAIGTNLFAVGLETGDAPELWNIDHPDRIAALHRSFVEAGSDIVLTNSFGGTRYRLNLHKAGERVAELNQAAARIARAEADKAERTVLVAGSMGPTGEILEPNGALSIEAATEAFREQALALAEGGCDILWIETISSAEEIRAAVAATAGIGLPVVYTVSIDTNGRTMMGLTASETAALVAQVDTPITAIGTNCGVGAAEVVAAVLNFNNSDTFRDTANAEQIAIVAKANCGIPEYVDGSVVYNGTPPLMAAYAVMAANAGARIVGGCCGTSPEHIAAMRKALDERVPGEPPTTTDIEATLGPISTGALAQLGGDLSVAGGSASGRGARTSRRRRRRDA